MAARKPIDLDSLTISELEQLGARVVQEIARKRMADREWREEHGTQIVEADAPKYQNPNNAAQTWSGKGKQPRWVAEVLAQGHTLESLCTDDLLPVSRRPGEVRKRKR